MSVREHRSLYVDLYDSDDFLALSFGAKAVFKYLRLKGTAIGLRKWSVAKAVFELGCTRQELEGFLQELERPLPGQELGWIVREADLLWVVSALGDEPSLTLTNRKHRGFVTRLVDTFDPALRIVQLFRVRYAAWLADVLAAPAEDAPDTPPEGIGMATDTVSDAYSMPTGGVSKHGTSTGTSTGDAYNTRPSDRVGTESPTPARAPAAVGADEGGSSGRTDGRRSVLTLAVAARPLGIPPRPEQLTPLGAAWKAAFLADATPERWAYVADEIDQALTPEGVSWESKRRGTICVSTAPPLLAAHLWSVLAEAATVERPESAHLVALSRIRRGEAPMHDADGRPVAPPAEARRTEQRAKAAARLEEQSAARREESQREADLALHRGRREVARFQEQHPRECAELFQRAKREIDGKPMPGGEVVRVQAIEALHIRLVQARARELVEARRAAAGASA